MTRMYALALRILRALILGALLVACHGPVIDREGDIISFEDLGASERYEEPLVYQWDEKQEIISTDADDDPAVRIIRAKVEEGLRTLFVNLEREEDANKDRTGSTGRLVLREEHPVPDQYEVHLRIRYYSASDVLLYQEDGEGSASGDPNNMDSVKEAWVTAAERALKTACLGASWKAFKSRKETPPPEDPTRPRVLLCVAPRGAVSVDMGELSAKIIRELGRQYEISTIDSQYFLTKGGLEAFRAAWQRLHTEGKSENKEKYSSWWKSSTPMFAVSIALEEPQESEWLVEARVVAFCEIYRVEIKGAVEPGLVYQDTIKGDSADAVVAKAVAKLLGDEEVQARIRKDMGVIGDALNQPIEALREKLNDVGGAH